MIIGLFIIGWFACGAFAYAGTLAYWQGVYLDCLPPKYAVERYKQHVLDAIFVGLTGPIGLLITTFLSGFFRYGLKLK